MKLLKKCVLVLTAIGAFTCSYMPSTSYAYEVEVTRNDGIYWVETDSIRKSNGVYSATVYYGMNHSRVYTYKFAQNGGIWYCQNPGSWDKWEKVEPNSSDNDILYIVLNNS